MHHNSGHTLLFNIIINLASYQVLVGMFFFYFTYYAIIAIITERDSCNLNFTSSESDCLYIVYHAMLLTYVNVHLYGNLVCLEVIHFLNK